MRFELRPTSDGSLTVYDHEVKECYKSRHAARLEAEYVFFRPGVLENPFYESAKPFRVLELGFGLGTNFLHLLSRNFQGEFVSIERDMAGVQFFLSQESAEELALLVSKGTWENHRLSARILKDDFHSAMDRLKAEGFLAHAIFFDPFSPKANPESWTSSLFEKAASLLAPGGRLVTYSVSRAAKDAAIAAKLSLQKLDLPPELHKRSSLLATKPIA